MKIALFGENSPRLEVSTHINYRFTTSPHFLDYAPRMNVILDFTFFFRQPAHLYMPSRYKMYILLNVTLSYQFNQQTNHLHGINLAARVAKRAKISKQKLLSIIRNYNTDII